MHTGTIGIIGLGLVGRALVTRLRGAGRQIVGYDIDPLAMQAFCSEGGKPAASLAALGEEVETVVLAVFDTQGVLQALEGSRGLLSGANRLRLVIDCSTGAPDLLIALAQRMQDRGVHFAEAPMSGSSTQIAAGEATALVGAAPGTWRAAEELLRLLAPRCILVGPPGMGAKAKLATNLVLGLNRAVFAEGLAFAESLGIPPAQFLQLVLATPATSEAARLKGPLMVEGDFKPRSRIRQHLKDVRLMLEAAHAQGLVLPFSHVHAQLMQEAVEQGRGDLDNAAIVLQLRGIH